MQMKNITKINITKIILIYINQWIIGYNIKVKIKLKYQQVKVLD